MIKITSQINKKIRKNKMEKKLLIVEDKQTELDTAIEEAQEVGITKIVTATNLEEALRYIPNISHVASDLFIPAGNLSVESYVQELTPKYIESKERMYPSLNMEEFDHFHCLLLEREKIRMKYGDKSNELSKFDSNNLVNLPRSENRLLSLVLGGKETKEKMLQGHRNMLEVIEDVKAGKNLPLGYFVRKEAKSRKIPSVTVTSTYHHDLAFEPLRFQLEPYVDNLVEGKKDWKKGFEDLLDPNYRKIYFKE